MLAPAKSAPDPDPGGRLETWKEIATYLKRDVRTVQRWEKLEGLPVHRHLHAKVATVYAYPHELDEWWSRREPLDAAPSRPASGRYRTSWFALVAGLLVAGIAAGIWHSGDAARRQVAARRLWSGPDMDHFGSVSPDGRWLAITSTDTRDLAKVDLGSGSEILLTRKPPMSKTGAAFYPVFSADGSRIAYTWDEGDALSLRVIGSGGAGERVLFREPCLRFLQVVDWSADGRQIVVVLGTPDGANRLAIADAANGSLRDVAELHRTLFLRAALSPDRRWVALDQESAKGSTSDRDIVLFPLDGGPPAPLVTHPDNDWMLGWARDGRLLFACDRSGAPDAWMLPVSAGAARGPATLLLKNFGPVWPVGFDRDGAFYYGLPTSVTDVHVASMDFAEGKVVAAPQPATTRYAGVNGSPDWSPDGSQLAYVPFRRRISGWSTARVIVRDTVAGAEKVLRPQLATIESMRWAPDGAGLVASAFDLENRPGVMRIDAQTGGTVTLTGSAPPGATYHEAFLSADGRRVYYKKRVGLTDPSPLMVLDLETRIEKQFHPSVYRLAVSPQGDRLAWSTFDRQRERIFVAPLAGGPPREIHSEPRTGRIVSVAWAPGGRHLLYARRGELWRVALDGGPPAQMPLSAEAMRELRVHPDGRRIAFTSGSTARSELWKVENLLTATPAGSP